MFKKDIRQKWATRTLNKDNRVLYGKNADALAQQLLVLKQVNDQITGRHNETGDTAVRAWVGQRVMIR